MEVETKTDNSQRQSSSSTQPILVDTSYGRLPLSELRDDGVCVVQLPFSHSAQLFVNANQVADNNQRKLKRSDEVEDEQKDEFVPVKRQNSLPRADGAATLPTNVAAAPFTPAGSIVTFGSRNGSFNVSDPIHNPFAQPAASPVAQLDQQPPASFPLFGSQLAAANGTAGHSTASTTAEQLPLFQPRGSSIPPHHTSSISDAAAPAAATQTAASDETMQ